MKVKYHSAVIIIFYVLLMLPLFQQVTGVLPVSALGGEEVEVKAPGFHLNTWFDRKFQQEIDDWYNFSIGMRPWMIRTSNQINLSLFGKFHQGRGTKIYLGQKDVLFEKMYVNEYYNPKHKKSSYLRRYIRGVSRLQELLELNNVVFLLVIAPSKAEIYPEYLHKDTKLPPKKRGLTHYQRILPLLDEFNINYIDGHKLFLQWKAEGAPWLFARGGTHWNYYGAGKIVQLLIDNIAEKSGQDFDNIEVSSYTMDSKPYGTDNDLESLLNRWFSGGTDKEQIHPVFNHLNNGKKPNLLMIGDSFAHTLTHILKKEKLFENCDLLYYSRRRYSWPADTENPINSSKLDFQKEMLGKDAVIIEITEQNLPKFGFGILRYAITALEATDAKNI